MSLLKLNKVCPSLNGWFKEFWRGVYGQFLHGVNYATLWTVDDEISKFLAIVHWEMFLHCWTICLWSCSQSGETRPIVVCEWLRWNTHFQWTCSHAERSKQLSQSFVASVPAFLEHVAGFQFKMSDICKEPKKFICSNIKYLVFVVYSIENGLKRVWL